MVEEKKQTKNRKEKQYCLKRKIKEIKMIPKSEGRGAGGHFLLLATLNLQPNEIMIHL